ncbi:MAG: DEAD/DEAH box helicase [Bacilli bacterium]
MKFEDFGLDEPIMRALLEEGYEKPTLIQEKAIPIIMSGQDLLGCAQTGTGKTAAFALPIIQGLMLNGKVEQSKKIKALILTPTRELAIQIRDVFRNFEKHTNLKCSVILGGVNQQSQVEVLKKGVDVLVATPGRLLDLINQKHVRLENLKYLVLDEADTMLDMGFIHDIKRILITIPANRQTLLFSATMPKAIEELSSDFLKSPKIVKVAPVSSTVDTIKQSLYYVDKSNKLKLLIDLMGKEEVQSALIFTRTKHGANKLGEALRSKNISCGVIHGNKSQSARVLALKQFKEGKLKALIATDIAARGIDIQELSHVFNYEMPNQAETYVHRIGRTGRAGFEGHAISFCNIDEKPIIKEIEALIKKPIPVITDHFYPMIDFTLAPKKGEIKGKRNVMFKTKNNSYDKNSNFKNNMGNRNAKFKQEKKGSFHSSYRSNRGK